MSRNVIILVVVLIILVVAGGLVSAMLAWSIVPTVSGPMQLAAHACAWRVPSI